MHFWAAIFDWDGVVIDSSRQHERAWQRLAEELGRPLPEGYFRRSFGMKNETAIAQLLGWTRDPTELARLSQRKEECYRELIRAEGVAPLPGVVAWLEQLSAAKVPCAVGSSTPRENIECVMEIMGLRTCFQTLVCAQDVTHGKPDPEVFLMAGQRLGHRPERCVVFEDAHVGIAAARAARMKVVAVATTNPACALGDADLIVNRLDELTVDRISEWFPE